MARKKRSRAVEVSENYEGKFSANSNSKQALHAGNYEDKKRRGYEE